MSDLQSRIRAILDPAIEEISELMRQEATREIGQRILASVGAPLPPPQLTLTPSESEPAPQRTRRKSLLPKHCIHPDCHKDSKGPRFTFMCEDHIGISKKDKAKFLAAWKQSHQG